MTRPRFELPADAAASVPTGRRRRWDLRLIERVEPDPASR
jgi:hypothetical protein